MNIADKMIIETTDYLLFDRIVRPRDRGANTITTILDADWGVVEHTSEWSDHHTSFKATILLQRLYPMDFGKGLRDVA